MEKLKKIVARFPFLRYLGNKYILVLFGFLIWMLFLDNYSYLEHRILNKEINELEDNINYYTNEIYKDSVKIKKLKNDAEIEKYAREKYYMKHENEDVYIIEHENTNAQENSNIE
ncbi:septum formation initiator family protein [Flavobacterium sp.]|uniref:FtsB family cell division protein n=1 Tax=Flavobacterium sp. TaxID=239 RepID=UPI003527C977